jgi:hypothetical protein
VLEEEGSPYRFLSGTLTPITDGTELQAISDTLRTLDEFACAREHITSALDF